MPADRSRLPELGVDPAFRFPTIVHHTLANGLRVRTVEHRSVPVVTLVLQVEGGSGADPSAFEGLSAITADMVDEGTGVLSAIDVSEALARIGGEYGMDTGPDTVTFSLTTLQRYADRGAGLLSDIVTNPSLRQADFDRVRQLRLDRLTQVKDVPPAVAERAFLKLLYGDHPYGHLSIGTRAALQRLSLEDVARFHEAGYRPSRATLVVAGDMPHVELARVAERAFGGWVGAAGGPREGEPAGVTPFRPLDDPQAAAACRLAIVPRDGAAQSELRIGQLSARRSTPDYAALLVMNSVLGGQFVSRINLKLREEKGFTYGAHSGFAWRHGLAPFSVEASVHTAATAEAIADSLAEVAAVRGSRPPSDTEMTLAKASLTRGYPRGFETAPQVARAVAQLALYGLPDTYFEEFVPKVHAIESTDVTAAATKYLDPATLTILIVGDRAVVGPSLASLGLGEPVVLEGDE